MKMTYQDDLKELESLSVKISDLVHKNDFKKIIELDLERKKIIYKISYSNHSSFKDRINDFINMNKELIENIEVKMKDLSSNHNKFTKRIKLYSLSK
jgi:predicted transcriptional regulator